MEKQKRWQFYLIIAVMALTLYNILPTVFYYTKPLNAPIDEGRAQEIATMTMTRVNHLEDEAVNWLHSFANLLKVKPTKVASLPDNPGIIEVVFQTPQEASKFKQFLPRAGAYIPFVPAQLDLYKGTANPETVLVERRIGIRFDPSADLATLFQYAPKQDEQGKFSQGFQDIVTDRVSTLALAIGGENRNAKLADSLTSNLTDTSRDSDILALASEIVEMERSFAGYPKFLARYFSSFVLDKKDEGKTLTSKLAQVFDSAQKRTQASKEALSNEEAKLKKDNLSLSSSQAQSLASLEHQIETLTHSSALVKAHSKEFTESAPPLTTQKAQALIAEGAKKATPQSGIQIVPLEGRNPFIEALVINWNDDLISLKLYNDLVKLREEEVASEVSAFSKERLNQFLINEIAKIGRNTDEVLTPDGSGFSLALTNLPNASGFLTLNLEALASKQAGLIQQQLSQGFSPKNPDLKPDVYPVRSFASYSQEKPEDQRLGFVIFAPAAALALPDGFKPSSIYVIAKGLDTVMQKYQTNPASAEGKLAAKDLEDLQKLMQEMNFIGYPGNAWGLSPEFARDYIFELDDYYSNILKASREAFEVKGSKHFAVLPFTNVEQRIITYNKIEDQTQEDLLKSVEAYTSAQVDPDASAKYIAAPPTENPYWSNFKISLGKYFHGDDRKIIKWGLDLSGGKSVRIGLRDHNNQPVTNPDDIRTAVNQLYERINKMGVSERTIRVENNNIVLEFPGSQALSASDLVKASAMYFHIVNEKFSPSNPALRHAVDQFLQNVWNEAVVTNRKDIESIKEIAWKHLGGDGANQSGSKAPRAISESAQVLLDNGLKLANPNEALSQNGFDDTFSTIAMSGGDHGSQWEGQTNPLLFIFNNFALEGSSLTNVQIGYDPNEGNNLTFTVKRSYDGDRSGSPRDDFYAWTSQFAEDKISGTPKEAYTQGRGWKMAVILNGSVVSKPSLRAALRDTATITGRFSTREINELASDLKAGSLSFTPKILSEQNISAELGQEERTSGIAASLAALALVVIAMCAYYRFAGLVASCAVLLNIFIMWGVLQNLGAAITLPAIAGIVLTIGMAVDANVLVFERVREEFALSGRIASAIQAGYRKAFTAIIDSNITTIIAALILIQFDSGPIKGFAVTLIVGIISSMFTSLFMTRYYFAGWVQNPEHKQLSMAQFFQRTNFDFLKTAKLAIIISVVLMLAGSALLYKERKTIFGMDFTGGYAMTLEVEPSADHESYRIEAANALLESGASPRDIQVRELTHPNQLQIQMGMGMEEKGQPFYQLPEKLENVKFQYEYQNNPRIVWIVQALEKGGLKISEHELSNLSANWSVMSGQFSNAMRNNAIWALTLALLSILIYITFRFEFKYAAAAVVGLAHDVIITLGILAFFHWMGFLVQIDLQVIGAIMTIIGYSLNDTIIVFDRIREDLKLFRKMTYPQIINHALNVTLSRTVMTSGTTLLVLFTLVLFGGHSIFAFSLVMTIGVLVGTFSSLFIAAPMLLFMHNREEAQKDSQGLSLKGSH
jgi:SecD/SecF fusion protein